MEAIRAHDAAAWWLAFLANLERVRSLDDSSSWGSPEPIREATQRLREMRPSEASKVLGGRR
jgi:hypothetical protein